MSTALIDLWRAPVSGDFSPMPVPMIWVCTASDQDCEGADSGEVVEAMTSCIWFLDRSGWRAAWRLARVIAGGRSIFPADLPRGVALAASFSPIHYQERVQ